MAEWALPRSAFTAVLALTPLGMMIGGWAGGLLGDRAGRRIALVGSVVAFAVPTLAIAWATGPMALGVLRFLAGLGLGGAMPNAAALASEYVPPKQRPIAVTLTIVSVPLGGTLAALLAGRMLPHYGWRALFVVGGITPIVVALALYALLPESPQFLDMQRDHARSRVPFGTIVAGALRRDTLGLCAAFFFCLLANYVGFNWIVALLAGAGFAQSDGTSALAA